MILEMFNLVLAAGGGVAVPTGVGLFARWMVNKQDAILGPRTQASGVLEVALTSENTWSADDEPAADRNPITA